ncbi:protein tyrosine phosphatase, non-receptor type 12 [Rhizophlyctis rosea]|nr:protein tyrosine phosphatase, non-receptor type 12 [Rhizophlyctis rosea]
MGTTFSRFPRGSSSSSSHSSSAAALSSPHSSSTTTLTASPALVAHPPTAAAHVDSTGVIDTLLGKPSDSHTQSSQQQQQHEPPPRKKRAFTEESRASSAPPAPDAASSSSARAKEQEEESKSGGSVGLYPGHHKHSASVFVGGSGNSFPGAPSNLSSVSAEHITSSLPRPRTSLASRRSSSASGHSDRLPLALGVNAPPVPSLPAGINKPIHNHLQPPKLDTTGFTVPFTLPPSPMSAGTLGESIPSIGEMIDEKNLPPWLRRIVMMGENVGVPLQQSYQEIEARELERIREGVRNASHPNAMGAALKRENQRRNRYTDIIPYDGTRVPLLTPSQGSDYINASYLHGLPSTRPYIASQGPLPNTIGDFWQMVWEQNVRVIVMLTKEDERGRRKCERYWPDTERLEKGWSNLGGLRVRVGSGGERRVLGGEGVLREIDLIRGGGGPGNTTPEAGSGERRTVHLLHFLAWPDHRGSNAQNVLHIIDLAEDLQTRALAADASTGPMIVHCSAGCGRTGTFCAISTTLQILSRGEGLDDEDVLFESVEALRKCRVSIVQTVEQWAFCYEAVLYRILQWQSGVVGDGGGEVPGWIVRKEIVDGGLGGGVSVNVIPSTPKVGSGSGGGTSAGSVGGPFSFRGLGLGKGLRCDGGGGGAKRKTEDV